MHALLGQAVISDFLRQKTTFMAGMTAILQHIVAFILHKEGACIVVLFHWPSISFTCPSRSVTCPRICRQQEGAFNILPGHADDTIKSM